jgi:hypothetical protein
MTSAFAGPARAPVVGSRNALAFRRGLVGRLRKSGWAPRLACSERTRATRRRARLLDTLRAATPVRDLGLVDLIATIVEWLQARRGTRRAIDVDDTAAGSADQVMVIVADTILETGG